MRYIVYGAGAIGGVIGGRLHEHGRDVVLIARGAHHDAIRDHGLRLADPDRAATLDVPVVDHPSRLTFGADDVVVLAMKSQDTEAAVRALAAVAPPDTAVVCAQNGVENERIVLRRFARTYGMCVMLPATHLAPGEVLTFSAPTPGILDLGRYPTGVDDVARAIADDLGSSSFVSEAASAIMRRKWAKLRLNLANAIEALSGGRVVGDLYERLLAEADACLAAAGIDCASDEEDRERRGDHIRMRPIGGERRGGGSTWQSLARGAGDVEVDYLNGEIVLLGRQLGIPTPANEALCRLTNEAARSGAAPGTVSLDGI